MQLLRFLKTGVGGGLAAFTALAVYDQLVRAPEHRTWEGVVFGVPYDFRAPSFAHLRQRLWNPDDPRRFTPPLFGVGWSVNLARLLKGTAAG